jgi:hypothetical protein
MGENRSYPYTPRALDPRSAEREEFLRVPMANHPCATLHGLLIGDTRAGTAAWVPITHTTVRQEGDGVSGAEGTGQGSQAPDEKRVRNNRTVTSVYS